MARTGTEKRIVAERSQQGGILVPKLNEILKTNIGIDSKEDADFLHALAMKQVLREQERKRGDGVYSPSGLASCMRRVYLAKNWQRLGLTRVELPAIEPHYYFLTGDFIHLKWQFAMYKLSLVDPDFMLLDCEVSVLSKRKDHGGTIDVVCLNDGELQIVDVKGLQRNSFYKVDENRAPHEYRMQVGDYMMLWNAAVTHNRIKPTASMKKNFGWEQYPKVHTGIILAENKGGPDARHPAALTEQVVKLKDVRTEIRGRLEILRAHEEEDTLPDIECVSTRSVQFQGCPFAEICRREVKRRERENAKGSDPKQYRVSQPKRNRRTGRS